MRQNRRALRGFLRAMSLFGPRGFETKRTGRGKGTRVSTRSFKRRGRTFRRTHN